jgi:DNA repair photolyase
VYNINHKFEDIEVKENAVELLKKELIKRKPCMIGTGAMTDPYIPLEKRLEYVRKSLKLVYRYGFGWACITKSDLVLRDIDLLKKINEKTKAVVQITLTTADDDLCRMIEPNVCATSRRVEVLQRLKEENIPTVVWLCPLLPHINATEENINALLDFCIDAEVKGVLNMGMGLSLREGNREYFYEQLDKSFPGLKERYIEEYGDSYFIHSRDDRRLRKILRNRCDEHGIMHNQDEIFSYLHEFPEKSVQSKLL